MLSTTAVTSGLIIVAVVCILLGTLGGWMLRGCMGEHPLHDKPLRLTGFQCQTIAHFAEGCDIVLRYRREDFDIAAGHMMPAGLYAESLDRLPSGAPAEVEYLAVSPDDALHLDEIRVGDGLAWGTTGHCSNVPRPHFLEGGPL